jgi:hypothetical protein
MPRVTFDAPLLKLIKELNRLGQNAEALGHALKDIAIGLGKEDLGRMMAQLHGVEKRDSNGHASTEKPQA